MKEYKVGERFSIGFVTLEAVKAKYQYSGLVCEGCIFGNMNNCTATKMSSFIGECFSARREDRVEVVFKIVEDTELND